MADKTVGELPRASTVTTTDLFVMEQAGQAKSLTGQVLINDLATALDGHGGIKSITLNDDYTLTFIMSDDTEVKTTSVRGATRVLRAKTARRATRERMVRQLRALRKSARPVLWTLTRFRSRITQAPTLP